MKRILLTIALLVCFAATRGQQLPAERTVYFRFVPGDDMFYIPWEGNDVELSRLYSLVDEYRAEITAGTMPVYVDGYSATKALSFIRANRVKSELILHKGLNEDHFITKNYATAYTAPNGTVYKDMVVVTLQIPAKPEPTPEPKPEPSAEGASSPTEARSQPQADADTEEGGNQMQEAPSTQPKLSGFEVRTNLLYDALLTPTIGLEWRINRNVGIKLDGSWAHWGNSHGRVQKLWLVSSEVRWYLLNAKQFYVGLGANFGEANIYKGILSIHTSSTGYQGNIYGGGVTVGYKLPLNSCLSMDFNLGLGVTHFSYDTFTVSNEVRVYHGRNLTKNFWGPTQAGVSLIWRVGGSK